MATAAHPVRTDIPVRATSARTSGSWQALGFATTVSESEGDADWLARDPVALADFMEGVEDARAGRVTRLESTDAIDDLFR